MVPARLTMRRRSPASSSWRLKITGAVAFTILAVHLASQSVNPSAVMPDVHSRSPVVRRLMAAASYPAPSGDGTELGKGIPRRKWWGGIDDDDDAGDDDADPCSGAKIRSKHFHDINYTSTCAFVEDYCNGKGTGLLAYMYFNYCTMAGASAVSVIILICWLLVIISLLATTADFFFVPQLETLSAYLHLSPDIAGITLLALGNGAPDVFAAKAALDSGDESDFPLMLSDLLGASVFISTVVLGSVCWVSNITYKTWQIDKESFQRDVGVYMIAVCVILITASNGTISQVEAGCYLVIYFAYIIVVVVQSNRKLRKAAAAAAAGGDIEDGDDSGGSNDGDAKELNEPLMRSDTQDLIRRKEGEDQDEEQDEEEKGRMFGVDWDPEADTFTKVQFIVEYPFSVLRWLSTPGADMHWDRRRRLWTCASPPFTMLVILLDSPWNGTNGFSYITYGTLGGFTDATDTEPKEAVGFSIAALCVILGCIISVCFYFATSDDKIPKFYPLIVLMAFLSTIMWLDFIANELVAVIESLGRMMNISTSILGLTVIAMGNSVGDLVADMSTARNISPKMGVASCFGSPLLNDILGIGIATVIYTANGTPVQSPLNAQDRIAYLFLFMSLVSSAIFFPLMGYKTDSKNFYSFGLFGLYGVFMLCSCLVEGNVISKSSLCKWGGDYKICMDTSKG